MPKRSKRPSSGRGDNLATPKIAEGPVSVDNSHLDHLRQGLPLEKVDVRQDAKKGRYLLATSPFKPGEVIFTDTAFVYANWYTFKCIMCDQPHRSESCAVVREIFPSDVVDHIAEIEAQLVDLEAVSSLDRARALIKSYQMLKEDMTRLACFEPLTKAGMARSLASIKKIKKSDLLKHILPSELSNKELASVLSALNTNSHELEDIGGSGLFLLGCLMEHSCRPSCNFVTDGTLLTVIATEDIAVGMPLSIDYGDFFYRPTAERQEELQQTYEFQCTCPQCTTEFDRCRAFQCNVGQCPGPVCPKGSGQNLSDWVCVACQRGLTLKERKACLAAEYDAEEVPPESWEERQRVLRRKVLHRTHYLLFWPLEALAKDMAENRLDYAQDEILQVWQELLANIEVVLPRWHEEKGVYYDGYAQVLITLGDIQGAKAAYGRALEIYKMATGLSSKAAVQVQRLYERTPETVEEMMFHYKNIQDAIEEMHYQEDKEGLEEVNRARGALHMS